jgi:hypothetical protein
MTLVEYSWSASESEPIEPFGVSRSALDECSFRLTLDGEFETAEVRTIEDPKLWDNLAPELLIHLDVEDLRDTTGLEPDNTNLSIVIRDRELNRFLKVEQWPLTAIPTSAINLTSKMSAFSQSDRLDVCLVVTPSTSTAGQGDNSVAANRGDVVARKVFKIRTITQSSKLPHRWVKPEEFRSIGAPEDTIWLVNWLGEDLDRPPVETFEIWLNETYREKFKILPLGGNIATLFQHEMAAAIFSEVALVVLNSDQEETTEPTGTLQIVSAELTRMSGLSHAELRRKLQSHGGASLVRTWVHSTFQVGELFSDLNFVGGTA